MMTDPSILFREEINRIGKVAGYLWDRGWAERNGGNLSVRLALPEEDLPPRPETADRHPLPMEFPRLAGEVFYITGAGRRMRDVAGEPLAHGCILRISDDSRTYSILSAKEIVPSSELASHLLIHADAVTRSTGARAVLHTHPSELIALSHCPPFLDPRHLTRTLWSMIPECRIVVPRGVGVVPYMLTGTVSLAEATIRHLAHHDVLIWEKHGVLSVTKDIEECFDVIDTLVKAARIYLDARATGSEPQGLTNGQLEELAAAFGLPPFPL